MFLVDEYGETADFCGNLKRFISAVQIDEMSLEVSDGELFIPPERNHRHGNRESVLRKERICSELVLIVKFDVL